MTIEDNFRQFALPFTVYHPGAIFQRDNVRPLTDRISLDNVATLPCLARLLDFSLIERETR